MPCTNIHYYLKNEIESNFFMDKNLGKKTYETQEKFLFCFIFDNQERYKYRGVGQFLLQIMDLSLRALYISLSDHRRGGTKNDG